MNLPDGASVSASALSGGVREYCDFARRRRNLEVITAGLKKG